MHSFTDTEHGPTSASHSFKIHVKHPRDDIDEVGQRRKGKGRQRICDPIGKALAAFEQACALLPLGQHPIRQPEGVHAIALEAALWMMVISQVPAALSDRQVKARLPVVFSRCSARHDHASLPTAHECYQHWLPAKEVQGVATAGKGDVRCWWAAKALKMADKGGCFGVCPF